MPWKDRTVVSIREEFVLKALEPNTIFAALCREFGVSRKTGYKWIERYESGGVLALRDPTRRPRTSPLGVSPEVVVDLIAIRNAHPHWGARKLIWALQKSGARSAPSERTVNRILERAELIVRRRLHPRPAPDTPRPDASAEKPNALWTADYKGWWRTGRARARRYEPEEREPATRVPREGASGPVESSDRRERRHAHSQDLGARRLHARVSFVDPLAARRVDRDREDPG